MAILPVRRKSRTLHASQVKTLPVNGVHTTNDEARISGVEA
jgi:hypothetical protein